MSISNEHLVALGRLTVNFGNLELWLALAVWSLLDSDGPTSQTVTAELSFRSRLNLLLSLAKYKLQGEPALLAGVEKFVGEADTAEQSRNQLVHSHWLVGADGGVSRLKFTAKTKGLRSQSEDVPAQRIAQTADSIRVAIENFQPTMGKLITRAGWIELSDGPPTGPPSGNSSP